MKKIMLVDDADISNFIMKKLISNVDNTLEVSDFNDPQKAFDSITAIDPDIIFLDLNMPFISGFRFLEMMREKNLTNIVYILTSSSSELDKRRATEFDNVKCFLIKPLSIVVLAEVLQEEYVCINSQKAVTVE